jgi:uncharacterized protein HemX
MDEKENDHGEDSPKEVPQETTNVPDTESSSEAQKPEPETVETEPVYFTDTEIDEPKKDALPTPEQILQRIENEIKMKTETETTETTPAKKGKKVEDGAPRDNGGKPDNTLLIIGIAAVLIAVGLFLWLNYQKKSKALELEAQKESENDSTNGYDEREYYDR